MKAELNGIYWNVGSVQLPIPSVGDAKKASALFEKNLAAITWSCMRTLENNPATLPQTETILKGQSVGGISIFDLMQVKHYGDGAKKLVELLKSGTFALDKASACAIHAVTAKDEALEWGIFRTSSVTLHGIGYEPPAAEKLSSIAQRGFAFLETIPDPRERAVGLFLFMARNQFFFDANKRTASLMMNGVLIQNGFFPITILNQDSEVFHERLGRFYETGNANGMMGFFAEICRKLFSGQG